VSLVSAMLSGLADNCANTRSGRASNQASLEAFADHRANHCTPGASNQRAFSGADAAAPLRPLVIAVVRVTRIVVLPPVAALPDAVIKVLIAAMLLICVIAVGAITASVLICAAASAAVLPAARVVALLRQNRHTRKHESGAKGSCFSP
jgi:hypothetical protein